MLWEGVEFDSNIHNRPFDNDDPFYGLDESDSDPDVGTRPDVDDVIKQAKFSENYNLLSNFEAVVPAVDVSRHYAEDGSSWSNVLGYFYQSVGTRPEVRSMRFDDWMLFQQCPVALSAHDVRTGELLWEVPEYDQRCMVFWKYVSGVWFVRGVFVARLVTPFLPPAALHSSFAVACPSLGATSTLATATGQ